MADWLTGHWVLITAVHPREREELARLVAQAGGESQTAFSVRDPPHLVITRSVRSPKYRALLRAHPHTPVVTPDWLTASAQAGRLLSYADYKAGPFTGLTVCFSGLSASRKTALATLVVQNGGQHSPALDKRCTHLVTNSTDSEKYRFAVREGIVVVTTRWVDASLEAEWCQDEAPHALQDDSGGPHEGAGQSGEGGAAALLPPLAAGAEPTAALRAPPTAALLEETTTLSELAPGGSGAVPAAAVEPTAAAPTARGPSRLQRGARAADLAAVRAAEAAAAAEEDHQPGAALQAAAAGQAGPAALQAAPARMPTQEELDEQLEWDDDTPTFLDAVRLKLMGCSQAELREALGLVRQGAAKRFADWRDDLNHLVVGSELGPGEAAEASDFLSTHRACVPVSLHWLRESVAAQQRLRPDGFTVPFSRLAQHRRQLPALERVEAAGRVERSASFCSQASDGDVDSEIGRPVMVVSGPLEGCYFTLAAIRGSEVEARARRLIQESGGRVFTETTLARVLDKSRAFAICPPSLVATEATQLRSNCPDFKLVDERQRFTMYWLECSLLGGGPLPPSRGAPLYQPLPYPLPLTGMAEVIACTSGYDPPIREAIARHVETLGGRVTDSMTRRNTHLILPIATGRKYEFSDAFGVIPVTADWLVDTMMLGRRQPESHYRPRPPPEQPANAAAGAANRLPAAGAPEASRGSGGMHGVTHIGVTQIGVTQIGAGFAPEQQAAGGRRAGAPPLPPPPPQQQQQQQEVAPPVDQPSRQQLVLPPPPGPQQEAPGGTGGRRPTLRERLRANQAAAAGAAGGGWPAEVQQQQQQPVNDENAAGQGSNSGGGAGDLLQLGGKKQLTTRFQPPQAAAQRPQQAAAQQPQQRTALDDAMDSLGVGAQQAAAAAAPQQAPQQAQQQQVPSMFESLFGPSPHGSPAVPPAATPGGAAAPPDAAAAVVPGGVKREPPSQRPSPKQPAGRSSGRAKRSSSRLRPAEPPQPSPAEPEQPTEVGADDAAQQPVAAEQAAAAAAAGGSEPQEDMAKAIDSLGRLLGGLPAEAPARIGSQLDALMPPPPARTRTGSRRGASAPAESSVSNGSASGSRGGRGAKRPLNDDGAASGGSSGRAQPVRRSGRGRATDLQQAPHLEMSQQVGYADSLDDLPARMPTRSASVTHNQLLKQRLAAQAAGGAAGQGERRGAAAESSADPLADLLK